MQSERPVWLWITSRGPEHLDKAIAAFTKIGRKYDILAKTRDQLVAKYGE